MSIRSIELAEGLVVPLRRGFEPLVDSNGNPQADKDGQPVFAAEGVVAGKLLGRFADQDGPDLLRIRVVGNNPGHAAGEVVRLSGVCRLSAWYTPRARGSDARSDVTLSAERVEPARGAAPTISGGIAATLPTAMFLGQTADGVCSLMLPPEGLHTVEGLAEVRVASPVPADLIGVDVVPVGLRVFYVAPDREDVSQRSKAELLLRAQALERVGHTNGRTRGKAEPTPEPTPVEG